MPPATRLDEAQVPTGAESTSSSYLLLSGSRHLGAQAGTGSVDKQHCQSALPQVVRSDSDLRVHRD
jgi:hypothetical protein